MKIDPLKNTAMPIKRRWVAMLPAALLCVAGCAHERIVEPPAVQAAQSDSPAISPWAEPPPNVSVQEDPAYTQDPAQ
jgi:hypothetical protein